LSFFLDLCHQSLHLFLILKIIPSQESFSNSSFDMNKDKRALKLANEHHLWLVSICKSFHLS
jgi:hypothetical protein